VRLATNLHLVPRLIIGGNIPPIPPTSLHGLHTDNFTFLICCHKRAVRVSFSKKSQPDVHIKFAVIPLYYKNIFYFNTIKNKIKLHLSVLYSNRHVAK
jgi:hypothetical protein